jgi:hypothetical protein
MSKKSTHMSDTRTIPIEPSHPQEQHDHVTPLDYIKEGVEIGEHAAHFVEHPLAKIGKKILKPVTQFLEGLEVVHDFKENKNNGRSNLASAGGAAAGLVTRRALEGAAFAECVIATGSAESGVGIPLGLFAAGAAVKTLQQKSAASHAMNHSVAQGIDAIESHVADSEMHYSMAGVDEPGILLPKSMMKLTIPSVEPKAQDLKSKRETRNMISRLFESNEEQDKRIDEEFKQRDVKLEKNYKKERKKEDASAARIRAENGWDRKPEPDAESVATTENRSERFHRIKQKRWKQKKKMLKVRRQALSALSSSPSPSDEKMASVVLTAEDKQTIEFLMAYGNSPKEIAKVYQNTEAWNSAKQAVIRAHELKLERQQGHVDCIGFFNGMGGIFNALAQTGSSELVYIGERAAPIMMGLAHTESLWGIFSGEAGSLATQGFFASFGAISGLTIAGIGLLTILLRSNDEGQQRQLMESLNAIQQHISIFRREVHERFDHIDAAIGRVAGMLSSYCNQILRNQQMLFDQNRRHMELSLQGFRAVTTMINDVSVENRHFHERIYRQFSYLTALTENNSLKKLKKSIKGNVYEITNSAEEFDTHDPIHVHLMLEKLHRLEFDLISCASPDYNGQEEFALAQHDPFQSAQFLARRSLHHDDALGFLAEEIEHITERSLAESEIKKELLPATSLWSNTILDYIPLTRLPVFSQFNRRSVFNTIQKQYDNVLAFLQEIKESNIIPLLLERHQAYLDECQEVIYHIFTNRKKLTAGAEEKKSEVKRDISISVENYIPDGADRVVLDKALYKLDYNYLLLNRLAYLGSLPPEIQQSLSRLNRSADLLAQPFNFDERLRSQLITCYADASLSASGNYVYKYPYQYEHLETIGANLYGLPNEEKMVFVNSFTQSEDLPHAAASCNLNIYRYDVASRNATLGGVTASSVTDSKNPALPSFPLVKYKGNYNTSVDHVWASSHVVSLSQRPYLVFFSGGSGYVSLYNITGSAEHVKWFPCKNKTDSEHAIPFSVPLPASGRPNTTCYTHPLRDRYLLLSKVTWPSNGYPTINFYGFDLDLRAKKQLASYEVINLFNNWNWLESDKTIKCQWASQTISPNQFYINKVRPVGKPEALVYGIVQPGEQLSASFYRNELKESKPRAFSDMKAIPFEIQMFPIPAKTIHQTRSEVLKLGDENILIMPVSITTEQKENKIVFITADIDKSEFEAKVFDLPPVHPNSDWQAMRTAVAMIGGKEQLIVTLLSPDYQIMIFSYDPNNKKFLRLADGPQLNFLRLEENALKINVLAGGSIHGRRRIGGMGAGMDQYLLSAREQYPGHYPVRPIELRVSHSDDMSTLLIAYPTIQGPGPLNYETRVARIPLAPIFKLKSVSDIAGQLTASQDEKSEMPQNHLTTELCRTQLLLSLHQEQPALPAEEEKSERKSAFPEVERKRALRENERKPAPLEIERKSVLPEPERKLTSPQIERKLTLPEGAERRSELDEENSFSSAYRICKTIHKLLSFAMTELKLSDNVKESIKNEVKEMNTIIITLDDANLSSLNTKKKALAQLQTLFNIFDTIDGCLKENEIYASRTGININRQIDQLKEAIADIKKLLTTLQPLSPHVARGLFSDNVVTLAKNRSMLEEPMSRTSRTLGPAFSSIH